MNVPIDYLMFKISTLKRSITAIAFISTAALLFGHKGFALGYFMGGVISIAIFSILYKYVLLIKDFSQSQRKRFIMARALIIYAIMGVTLFIAIKKGLPTFFGTSLGLFSLKVIVFMELFKGRRCQAMNS